MAQLLLQMDQFTMNMYEFFNPLFSFINCLLLMKSYDSSDGTYCDPLERYISEHIPVLFRGNGISKICICFYVPLYVF